MKTNLVEAFKRFPFSCILAVFLGVASCYYLDIPYQEREHFLVILISSYFGIFIHLISALWIEAQDRSYSSAKKWLIYLSASGLTYLFYLLILKTPLSLKWIHTGQLSIFILAFGICLPWIQKSDDKSFWYWAKDLFVGAVLALFFSSVLCTGVEVILISAIKLLDLKPYSKLYSQVISVIYTGFFWLFLLGRVPAISSNLKKDYPKILTLLVDFFWIPLLLIYVAVLYVYGMKMGITAHWPKGYVASLATLALTAAVIGLFLNYPREEKSSRPLWVRFFLRFYFWILIPIAALVILGLWRRIHEYGITEPRYLDLVWNIWAFGVLAYFYWSRQRKIRLVIAALGLLMFFTFAGPWGIFEVSKRSQVARLTEILERNGLLVENQTRKPTQKIPFEDRKNICGILSYLSRTHGLDSFPYWAPLISSQELKGITDVELARKAWGIEFIQPWQTEDSKRELVFSSKTELKYQAVETRGYHFVVPIYFYGVDRTVQIQLEGQKWVQMKAQNNLFEFSFQGTSLKLDWIPLLNKLNQSTNQRSNQVQSEELVISGENAGLSVRIQADTVKFKEASSGELLLLEISGLALIRLY